MVGIFYGYVSHNQMVAVGCSNAHCFSWPRFARGTGIFVLFKRQAALIRTLQLGDFGFWDRLGWSPQLWPFMKVITGYFSGIIHVINGVISTYNWYFGP